MKVWASAIAVQMSGDDTWQSVRRSIAGNSAPVTSTDYVFGEGHAVFSWMLDFCLKFDSTLGICMFHPAITAGW
jgi:hypothetical protein